MRKSYCGFLLSAFFLSFLIGNFLERESVLQAASQRENTPPPPGIIIDASSNWQTIYLGSPSMEILDNGTILASHDWFGKESGGQHTTIFESKDQGANWKKIGEFRKQNSSTMFKVGKSLFMIGFCRPEIAGKSNDCVAIRRSDDGGRTWTEPTDSQNGLIFSDMKYYTDPVPVLRYNGRIWWQIDVLGKEEKKWPSWFKTAVISAPEDSDLLDAKNWIKSSVVSWIPDKRFAGWLEGNVVSDPQGKLFVIMRLEDAGRADHVAMLPLSNDGKILTYNPKTDIIKFPGGSSKFAIRYDSVSQKYWALTCWVRPDWKKGIRNTLALVCSADLKDWEVRSVVYQQPNRLNGFQYIDWRIVGDDIFFVCRLGWFGSNFHDSNYLSFDKIKNFRERTRKDDAKMLPDVP